MNLKKKSDLSTEALTPATPHCPLCKNKVSTSWHERTILSGEEGSKPELKVQVPVRYCHACEESFLDWEGQEISHNALCVHNGVLTPPEVKAIRKRHGLSRAAFSILTGIGEASLSRWETGSQIQSTANDRYLRLLQKPKNLSELRLIDALAPSSDGDEPKEDVKFPNISNVESQAQSIFQLNKAD